MPFHRYMALEVNIVSAKAYEALSKSSEESTAPQTAQSQEQQNDEEKEKKRRLKGSLIKFGALAVFAFIVWIFATISWFSSNSSVSGSGMGVKTNAISFQLKSAGSVHMDEAFAAATEYKDGISINGYYYTGEDNDNVKWRMTLSSAEKLEPGAFGELTFWVVPGKANTNLDMKFSVSMRGFTKSGSTWSESTDTTVLGYLNSHILFFQNRYPNPAGSATEFSYSGLINPDFTRLALTESDSVTIYWVWPNTFKQMMYVDGATELGGTKGIAYNDATLMAIKSYVNEKKTEMFPAATADLNTHVLNCCGSTATAGEKSVSITALDSAYNAADTAIGGGIQGALTELDAKAIAEHEIVSP